MRPQNPRLTILRVLCASVVELLHWRPSRDYVVIERYMPKLKTHSGAAKRFKKTGTGKIKRGHAFKRHILTSKGTKRKRQLDTDVMLDKADAPKIKRMIPY